MIRFLAPALAAALLVSGAPARSQAAPIDAPAGTYALDKAHASLTWRVNHLGLSMYTARFTSFDASIELDPANPARSSVRVTIDPKSVRTDFPFADKTNFDQKIAEEILMASQHPEIRFQSTALRATGATTGQMTGNLTFMGVTRPVTLDVRLNAAMPNPFTNVPTLGFSATGRIKRSEFGSTAYAPGIGDEVELIIEAEFAKK
jgi:polyisoprenoid-binding protein YceI